LYLFQKGLVIFIQSRNFEFDRHLILELKYIIKTRFCNICHAPFSMLPMKSFTTDYDFPLDQLLYRGWKTNNLNDVIRACLCTKFIKFSVAMSKKRNYAWNDSLSAFSVLARVYLDI